MPDFTYTARDRAGRTIQGVIHADNSALAAGKVREMGLSIERIRAVETARRQVGLGRLFAENFVYPVVSGVPLRALALFYRQFATLIDAGLPLYQSLVTLENQTKNQKLREIIRGCQAQVQAGGKLSDVLAGYPWVFSELQLEMIRAAEHGGMLDDMLRRIAAYLEQEIALRQLISRLTFYPKIVLVMAVMILGKGFFQDGLPALSKLVLGSIGKAEYGFLAYLFDTLFSAGLVALAVFAVVAVARITLFQSDEARVGWERFKMALPGLGSVSRQFALAKFGRAFGTMYAAGLPLMAAMRVAGNASGSRILAAAMRRAIHAVEQGVPMSRALRETGAFPGMVIDMLHTGEQTGNLDTMMTKVSEYLEGEAETKAHAYSHIFATVVYLVVAAIVGLAVVRFYSGYAGGAAAVGDL